MIDEQTCTTREVVAAIRRAYRGEAALGVETLLQHLVTAGVMPVVAVRDPRAMPIQTLAELPSGRRVSATMIWRLGNRFKTLGDLAALSFAELVAEPSVGAIPARKIEARKIEARKIEARKIEAALAGLSVLLRDGDPKLLRRPPAPEIDEPLPERDPEQVRATCGRALLLLARKMMLDGASLTAIAADIALDPDNARKNLRQYIGARYGRTAAPEVARIAAPILATGKKAETKRRRGRRAGPAAPEPTNENVVPVVFGGDLTVRK